MEHASAVNIIACKMNCINCNNILVITIYMISESSSVGLLITPMDSESDRTVESDTNINCTRFLFKSLNTYVNTFVHLVIYILVVCLYFFSILKFNKNISDTIYFGVRLHCPVRFTVHGCTLYLCNYLCKGGCEIGFLSVCFCLQNYAESYGWKRGQMTQGTED